MTTIRLDRPLNIPASFDTDEPLEAADAVAVVGGAEIGALDMATEDAALVAAARTLIADLAADPTMAVELAQRWLRDLGTEVSEDLALSAQDQAELNAAIADAARELERAARAAAAESNVFAQVFGWIGAALAVAVSVVGSVFTGGASLALGVAAVALMIAAQTVNVLTQEGHIDSTVGTVVSITASLIATVLSFGSTAAGSATQVATTAGSTGAAKAAEIAAQVAAKLAEQLASAIETGLNLAGSATKVANGVSELAAALQTRDADGHAIDATRNDGAADRSRELIDESVTGFRALMSLFQRIAELAAGVREARSEGMRAAVVRA